MMLSTLLQCCIVIAMQIKLTVVVVVVVDSAFINKRYSMWSAKLVARL